MTLYELLGKCMSIPTPVTYYYTTPLPCCVTINITSSHIIGDLILRYFGIFCSCCIINMTFNTNDAHLHGTPLVTDKQISI